MKCKKERPIKKIVAYYRVSEIGGAEDKIVRDAYSLEDQRRDVTRFAAELNATIISEFTDIASGTEDETQRPELGKAIYMTCTHRATLVVGRQDRLACQIYVICKLLNSELDFLSVDKPDRTIVETQFQAIFDQEVARLAQNVRPDELGAT
jgi:hypothetical protein